MTLLQAFSAGLTPRLWPPRSAANPFRQFSVHPPPPMVVAASQKNPSPDPNPSPNPSPEAIGGTNTRRGRDAGGDPVGELYPATIPRKPRRGRRGEAAAVEDFVRGSLERTFAEIRKQNSQLLDDKEEVLQASPDILERESGSEVLVEEDDPDWPADAEIGWGVRASEYFERHPIKNVVDGGVEIDWEGEMEEGLVKEINCLEWESFAFHPSPLVVLVFERYNRAGENWKFLMELEKAAEVYWKAKDRLPPRTVKIDMNIERDLAYALKVRECPQLLFLRGNRILYREKELRTAEELVQMIAHFYYNARRPTWVDPANVAPY